MKYEGYIVISNSTGAVVGGYPQSGKAQYFTRLGGFTGDVGSLIRESARYTVVRVEGEV